jgi:hypothetical protein
MDALDRLEPVVRPLLRQVDDALATLGAPAEHAIWGHLRRVGATPADAVTYFADLQPVRLRAAAQTMRAQAAGYQAAAVPASPPWQGGAATAYAAHAASLAAHLHGEDGLAGALRASASYVDDIADWAQRSRDRMARALAEVMASAQAVTVRSQPALANVLRTGASADLARAVVAAADIGAQLLAVADETVSAGQDVRRAAAATATEVGYRAPALAEPLSSTDVIHLRH